MGSCSQDFPSLLVLAAAALAQMGDRMDDEMEGLEGLRLLSGVPACVWAGDAHSAEGAAPAPVPVASREATPAAAAPAADVPPVASSAPATVSAESSPVPAPAPAIKSGEKRARKALPTKRLTQGNNSSGTQVPQLAGNSARQKTTAAAAAGPSSSGIKKPSGTSSRGKSRPSVASAALAALAVSGPTGPAAPPAAAVSAPAGPSALAAVLPPPAAAARARADLRAELVANYCVDGKWHKDDKRWKERHTALGWMEFGTAPRAPPCVCCQKRQDKLLRSPGTERFDSDLLLPCTDRPGVARVSWCPLQVFAAKMSCGRRRARACPPGAVRLSRAAVGPCSSAGRPNFRAGHAAGLGRGQQSEK